MTGRHIQVQPCAVEVPQNGKQVELMVADKLSAEEKKGQHLGCAWGDDAMRNFCMEDYSLRTHLTFAAQLIPGKQNIKNMSVSTANPRTNDNETFSCSFRNLYSFQHANDEGGRGKVTHCK